MWGHKISHNSYNAPLSVNSFKWGNKVKVTCNGDEITNDEYHYIEAFQTLIKSHKGLLKKHGDYNYQGDDYYYHFIGKTSAGNGVMNRYWSLEQNKYSNCIAFQANEAFVYTCAGAIGAGDYLPCDQAAMGLWDFKFEYGISREHDISDNKVYFNTRNAVLYYDRHGK